MSLELQQQTLISGVPADSLIKPEKFLNGLQAVLCEPCLHDSAPLNECLDDLAVCLVVDLSSHLEVGTRDRIAEDIQRLLPKVDVRVLGETCHSIEGVTLYEALDVRNGASGNV